MTVPVDSPTPTSPLLPSVSPRRRRPFYQRALPILIALGALLCITLLVLHRFHLLPDSNRGSRVQVGGRYPDPLELDGPLSPYLHDPSICVVQHPEVGGTVGDIAEAGRTYTLVSSGVGLPIRTSRDRITWVDAGHIFPISAPKSTVPFTGVANGNLWAPDITYVPGKGYWVYYAASRLGSQNSAIFLAWSATGLSGEWEDRGLLIESSVANSWNAIDPHLSIDETGAWSLVFGSYWGGIKLISLEPSTGTPNSTAGMLSLSRRPGPDRSQEAPFLFSHQSYWYLFTSWGSCCNGLNSTYSIHVSRSIASSIVGPYYDRHGTAALDGGGDEILGTHGTVWGPGGQSVFLDADGPAIVYHYSAEKPHTYHIGLNKLEFVNGWPNVV